MATETVTTKICAGAPKHGIPAHEAPVSEFGKNAAYEDGLSRVCKTDWTAYTKILKDIKVAKAETEATTE